MASPEQETASTVPPSSVAARAAVDAEPVVLVSDSAILEFGQRWYPFGGGSSDTIFLEFGLSSAQFFERLTALLDVHGTDMDPTICDAMHTVCRKRLWLGE